MIRTTLNRYCFMRVMMSVIAVFAACLAASAQTRCPNTTWPYLYENFQQGQMFAWQADEGSPGLFNIHLQGNVLQYVNDGDHRVHKAETSMMHYLLLAGKRYVLADGRMMQEIYSHQKGTTDRDSVMLLMCEEADWDALFRYQGAAYGMSLSTAASLATHPFNLTGLDQPQYDILQTQKHDGREILLQKKYYVMYHGTAVKAERSEIQKLLAIDSKPFKAFVKQNSVNWKSPESLEKVIDYVCTAK